MNRGKRSTANKESDVNARAGVRSPPSSVNNPNEVTVTRTGRLFSINPLNCKTKERLCQEVTAISTIIYKHGLLEGEMKYNMIDSCVDMINSTFRYPNLRGP